VRSLFDHIFHPAAITQYLMGDVERLSYEWEDTMGTAVTTLRFKSGAIGVLHFAGGSSGSAPLERVEVVGEGANLAIENGARLIYYRKSKMPEYGRSGSFLAPDETAPLLWEPERSLGQLYNGNDFLLGYAQEVREFFRCILENEAPVRGTLAQSREIIKLLDAYRTGEPGTRLIINPK
jgi:predicted dehydrogenase